VVAKGSKTERKKKPSFCWATMQHRCCRYSGCPGPPDLSSIFVTEKLFQKSSCCCAIALSGSLMGWSPSLNSNLRTHALDQRFILQSRGNINKTLQILIDDGVSLRPEPSPTLRTDVNAESSTRHDAGKQALHVAAKSTLAPHLNFKSHPNLYLIKSALDQRHSLRSRGNIKKTLQVTVGGGMKDNCCTVLDTCADAAFLLYHLEILHSEVAFRSSNLRPSLVSQASVPSLLSRCALNTALSLKTHALEQRMNLRSRGNIKETLQVLVGYDCTALGCGFRLETLQSFQTAVGRGSWLICEREVVERCWGACSSCEISLPPYSGFFMQNAG
jgi:hypothetical protein